MYSINEKYNGPVQSLRAYVIRKKGKHTIPTRTTSGEISTECVMGYKDSLGDLMKKQRTKR